MADKHIQGQGEAPDRLAEGTPPAPILPDNSWILQAVMEMQKSVGEMTKAISTLEGTVGDQSKTITWMSRVIFIATGILLATATIGGVVLEKIWTKLVVILAG